MPRNTLLDATRDAFVEPHSEDSIRTWTTIAGAALVAIGAYLPWLRYNPHHEGVGIVLSPQTTPGFEWVDLVLLVPVGLLIAFLALRGPTKWWTRATAVVGLAAVLLPAALAGGHYSDPDPYYVADVGLVLTVLGGLLLLVVAGYDRFARG